MNEQTRADIQHAIDNNLKPPKAFVDAVMLKEFELDDDIMLALVEKGWIPRTQCEIWTRVMGYFRPTKSFNAGKKSEFKERHYLDVRPMSTGAISE